MDNDEKEYILSIVFHQLAKHNPVFKLDLEIGAKYLNFHDGMYYKRYLLWERVSDGILCTRLMNERVDSWRATNHQVDGPGSTYVLNDFTYALLKNLLIPSTLP